MFACCWFTDVMFFNLKCNLYYLTRITVTCFWLDSNCLSCVRSVVDLYSIKTMCQLTEHAQPSVSVSYFSLLKWETPMFISSGLYTLHPDLNPVNYKICSEMQQWIYLRKVHKILDRHHSMAGVDFSCASLINYRTDE